MRLDVTSVLSDPAFQDQVTVIRNKSTPDTNGRVQLTPTTYTGVNAVVTQKNGNILRREAAGERIQGTIAVYTQFQLTDGRDQTSDLTADIVVYAGDQYTVTLVNDYSRWGKGWVSAVCEMIPVQPGDQPAP